MGERLVRGTKNGAVEPEYLLIFVLAEKRATEPGASPQTTGETVITMPEAARELGISRQAVFSNWIQTGELVPVAVWEGILLFRESDVRAVKSLRTERRRVRAASGKARREKRTHWDQRSPMEGDTDNEGERQSERDSPPE